MRKTNHRDCAIALLASREEVEFVSNDLKARDEDVKKLTERVKELEKEKKTIMDGWCHDNETIKSFRSKLDKAAEGLKKIYNENCDRETVKNILQSLREGKNENNS